MHKKYKQILILLSVISIGLLGIMIIQYFMNQGNVVLKKDRTCKFREQITIADFVKKVNGTIIENKVIDTNSIGTKKITLKYKDKYGFIHSKKFTIEIEDVIPPTVIVQNPYTIEVSSITNLMDTIFCADDYDDNVTCNIIGDYNLDKVGEYDLEIIAHDKSNNSTHKNFILNVVEPAINNSSNPIKETTITKFSDIYKQYKNDNTLIGLDLSKWQDEVDFSKLKEQGVEFVMLKVGGQKEINGEFIIDPKFYENIEQAQANDMKVGVYFYSYAKTEKEARKQAKWLISKIKDYHLELPIAFDWENWNQYTTFHISFHTLNNIASVFMKEVEESGYDSMLYSSKYYLETIWYSEEYTNWLAYYTKNNDYANTHKMWQLCNNGKIDGITGYVDIDVMYIDEKITTYPKENND